MSYPIILSFDVGIINLSYCLMTKKEFTKESGEKYIDFFIIDWAIINLTNRDEQKCSCGLPAKMTNMIDNNINYYCKKHSKEVNIEYDSFENLFNINKDNKCIYSKKNGLCNKKSNYTNNSEYYCSAHAKQIYNNNNKNKKLKSFKFKCSKLLNFDDVKYGLVMELEKRQHLLSCDHVVIENQPSFKNPRMKSIASTIYDYYLIRGIVDNIKNNKLPLKSVKFMSPSNKLKLVTEGDSNLLIKTKNTDESKGYKLTKSLSIKYCNDMTKHLPDMNLLFNKIKKKDDMADSFLQGVYMYNNL